MTVTYGMSSSSSTLSQSVAHHQEITESYTTWKWVTNLLWDGHDMIVQQYCVRAYEKVLVKEGLSTVVNYEGFRGIPYLRD